jgi:sugar/nucleoside kinase (ribokinase family)
MSPELCVAGLVYFELDVTAAVAALSSVKPGQETFVSRLSARLGGALNVASVARALGCEVMLCHPGGSGLTDLAISAAVAELSISVQTWPAGDDAAISLVVRSQGDRAFVSSAELDSLAACPELPSSPWIHVPGLREAELLAPQLSAARERGSAVSVSGSWAPSSLELLAEKFRAPTPQATGWDLLLLNADEADCVAGPREQWPKLRALAHEVVVTEGDQGATLLGPRGSSSVVARPATLVDATGAGDAFAAGFLVGRLRGYDDRAVLDLASAAAATVLGIHGGVVRQPEAFKALTTACAGVAP